MAPVGLFFIVLGFIFGPILIVGGLIMAAIAAVTVPLVTKFASSGESGAQSAEKTNVQTAMDTLMAGYPDVHFVTTGGPIEGVVTETYQKYLDLVDASPHKDRYHNLGWVESDKLPSIYRESDIGINVDAKNYETMFGARNRINAMAAEELPVATTIGTEISEWLDDGNAVMAAPFSDHEGLARVIEPWIGQREKLAVFGSNALRIMKEDFSYEKTTRSLISWLESPKLAPDNRAKLEINDGQPVADINAVVLNDLERQAFLMMRHSVSEIEEALDYHRLKKLRRKGFF